MKIIFLGLLCTLSTTIVHAADFDHRNFAWNNWHGKFCSGAKITNNTNRKMKCSVTLHYYSQLFKNTSTTQTNLIAAYKNENFGICSGTNNGKGTTLVSYYEVSCKYVKN